MNVYGWLIQNEDLSPVICPLLKSLFQFRRIKRNEMGVWRGAYKVLMEKPEGKRPLGRPRNKWEDNI
jgi:hypothetical protein